MISIDWESKVIFVPQGDLIPSGGAVYELDVNWFRLQLKDLEDSEIGMPFPVTHRHNTQVTLSGVTYARTFEIINGYTVEFENGNYVVVCSGANHNIADVKVLNSVSIVVGNAAGLIVSETGTSGLTPEESAALISIQNNIDTINSEIISVDNSVDAIEEDIENIQLALNEIGSSQQSMSLEIVRLLGLVQENYYMDQTVYELFNGANLLKNGRIRIYSNPASVGTINDVIATYLITSVWNEGKLQTYKVVKQ